MTLENAAWAYGAVASLMFFGPFLADVMDMAVARERFSRQLLGACVWPIPVLRLIALRLCWPLCRTLNLFPVNFQLRCLTTLTPLL